ncbi:Lcl C-terminal domain-containing protein [Cellvibrio fontiphilus]|uniref:DUF1566 domain-containing protein n=1 Tax=Cellvibrio fontiphilus TaxID=1815559 RepID=A0ABV7FJV7_9GAMM
MSQILPGDDQQRIASSSPSLAQTESAMPHNEQLQEQDRNRRFIKIDISGKVLADDASEWACVYDTKTQLLWEHNIGMPHDLHYRWSEPSENNMQPETCPYVAGKTTDDTENCTASVRARVVNRLQFCGSSTWQLPSIAELQTIILPNQYNPAVDTRYFPYTQSDYYWTREGFAYSEFNAWAVNFAIGKVNDVTKTEFVFVRLVSGASLNGDL